MLGLPTLKSEAALFLKANPNMDAASSELKPPAVLLPTESEDGTRHGSGSAARPAERG